MLEIKKPSNSIPDWVYEEGAKKGISPQTIYQRWLKDKNQGKGIDWDIILRPLNKKKISRFTKKGKSHSFRLPAEYDEKFEKAVLDSGENVQDFVADLVISYLKTL